MQIKYLEHSKSLLLLAAFVIATGGKKVRTLQEKDSGTCSAMAG